MKSILRSLQVLRKHWKFTVIAIFSLSITMALGVLALGLTNTFLLLPPAGADPDRLVMIYSRAPGEAIGGVSYPDYKYFRENNHVFSDVAASPNSVNAQTTFDNDREVKVVSRPVSDNYLAVLGIRPYLGRFFSPGDDAAKSGIAVMTYTCWKRFAGDPNIVGKTVAGYTIVGVAPKEFTGSLYGLNGDLLTSLSSGNDPSWFTKRDARHLFLIARLKPGMTKRQGQADMSMLSGQLATAYPRDDKNRTAMVTRATLLPPDAIPDAELVLAILIALVVLVLLIGSANVANLLLAIAVGRRQEAAIKLALGAARGRLVREFLRESAIICAASAALGYFIASRLVARYSNVTIDFPTMGSYSVGLNLRLDATVIAFTAGLMLIAIAATGLAPALYASAANLSQILSGEIVVGGTRKNLRRSVLVIAQVSVCTLVMVGMGLCQRSLYNLRHADPGFAARNLIALPVFSEDEHVTPESKARFQMLRERLAALPGVEALTFTKDLPLMLGYSENPVQVPGNDRKGSVAYTVVDSDYFATFGIRILAGRVFNFADRDGSPEVVVINRKMAETFWPGQDPVGESILVGDSLRKAMVAGIAADGKYESLDEATRPAMYYALAQHFQPVLNAVAKTKGDARHWSDAIAKTARDLQIGVPFRPITFDDWMNFNLLPQRITAICVSVLSTLGLLLAMLGLFGAISYSVSERKREFGIRAALGAHRRELLKMVLRQTARMTGTGVAIGILLGVAVTTFARSQFYGISPVELAVLIPVGVVMLGGSLFVAYLSARPWISADPMEAVRHA